MDFTYLEKPLRLEVLGKLPGQKDGCLHYRFDAKTRCES